MPPALTVRPVRDGELSPILPLIGAYQRFYGVREPDDERNRAFFARTTVPSGDRGRLLAAYGEDGAPVGFAHVQWSWDSVSACDLAVLYDLFVAEEARGRGAGRALMEAAAATARERGLRTMTWVTALDNRPAQRLYETFPARRDAWFEYTMEIATGDTGSAPGRT